MLAKGGFCIWRRYVTYCVWCGLVCLLLGVVSAPSLAFDLFLLGSVFSFTAKLCPLVSSPKYGYGNSLGAAVRATGQQAPRRRKEDGTQGGFVCNAF